MGRTQHTKFIIEGNLCYLITHSKLKADEESVKYRVLCHLLVDGVAKRDPVFLKGMRCFAVHLLTTV